MQVVLPEKHELVLTHCKCWNLDESRILETYQNQLWTDLKILLGTITIKLCINFLFILYFPTTFMYL